MASTHDYDVLVIGSGFGGSVAALRLTEKGYRVGVLEMGRRFADEELPETSWRLRRYLWAPWVRCFGIMRITLLKDVLIASGTGVGGGSLVYANTLYQPLDAFYDDPQWSHVTDWRSELAPHYEQARKMLGVAPYPGSTPADRLMSDIANDLGVGGTFHAADVGVLFGERPGQDMGDPYFGGAGSDRKACIDCGACMTGCRHNAKNTLVKNYLHLAEGAGAEVLERTTVTDVRPTGDGGYEVRTHRTGNRVRLRRFTAKQVVFAGNALNTQQLLHRLRRKSLPHLSPRVGELSRTNSEAVLSARSPAKDADFTPGVAITSSFHPDDQTHVEPVRYGRGSGALSLMNMALPDRPSSPDSPDLGESGMGEPGMSDRLRAVARGYRILGFRGTWRMHSPRRWAEQSIVVLVMQSLDNSITTFLKPRLFGLLGSQMTSKQGIGEPNPSYIPVADAVAKNLAERIGGYPGSSAGELVGVPLTAHFIGGCVIGESAAEGVVDPYQRVFGHDGLHISDGSTITANLGVNPSLTITAQSERAMSLWPNKDDVDTRPALGEPYVRIDPVVPQAPVVPADAPAALVLLPMPGVRPC